MPEGDSLHRIAARLRVLVGERLEAESPNGRVTGRGERSRRPRARGSGRRGEEPAPALRRRRRPTEPSAHERSLACSSAHGPGLARLAVARSPRARMGGDAVERSGARARGRCSSADSGPTSSRPRRFLPTSSRDSAASTSRASSVRRSSISASSPGSGTCGSRRPCGTPVCRRGRSSATSTTRHSSRHSAGRSRRCAQRSPASDPGEPFIGAPDGDVAGAGSPCAHAVSEMRTGRRTGARDASRAPVQRRGRDSNPRRADYHP